MRWRSSAYTHPSRWRSKLRPQALIHDEMKWTQKETAEHIQIDGETQTDSINTLKLDTNK